MKKRGLLMSEKDNVVVVLEDCQPGDTVVYNSGEIKVDEPILFGHKIALSTLSRNQDVIKYGETIGYMLEPITKGTWIHNHNMGCHRGKKE